MRPLKLSLEGFGGFRAPTTIDFTDLDLVALVGKTGSGKSTVLDAIVFALYGSVTRYDDQRSVAPIVNALSSEAKVQLEFELGGLQYTVARVVRRTKSGASTKEARLQQNQRVLADSAKEVTVAVEDILQLDVDQFTKVVVLPQGRFSAFLRDSASDRRKMLAEALGVHRYDSIGRRARELTKEASIRLAEKTESVKQLQAEAVKIVARKEEVATFERTQELVKQQAYAVRESQDEQDSIGGNLDVVRGHYRDLNQTTVPSNVETVAKQLQQLKARQSDREAAAQKATERWEEAVQKSQAGPNAKHCQQMLSDHAELTRTQYQIDQTREALSDAEKEQQEASDQLANQQDDVQQADAAVATAEQHEATLRSQMADQAEQAATLKLRDTHREHDRRRLEVSEQTPHVDKAKEMLKSATESHRSKTETLVARQRQQQDEAKALNAATIRRDLRIGDPCPVCESTVDTLPKIPTNDEGSGEHEVGQAISEAENEVAKAAAFVEENQKNYLRLDADLTATIQRADKLSLELKGKPNIEEVEAMLASYSTQKMELEAAIEQRQKLTESLRSLRTGDRSTQAERRMKRANFQVEKLHKKQAALMAQSETLGDRLAETPSVEEIEVALETIRSLDASVSGADDNRTKARQEVEDGAIKTKEAEVEVERHRAAFVEARDRLQPLHPPPPKGQSLLQDWLGLQTWASEVVPKQQQKKQELEKALTESKARTHEAYVELRSLVAGLDAETDEQLPPMLDTSGPADIEAIVTVFDRLLARAYGRLQAAQDRQSQAEKMALEVTEIQERQQVYHSLAEHLKASKFQDWILSEIVVELADRASGKLFELSSGHFSLEAVGLDFFVVDHLNGDAKREAKTLSGGETFLASLALALALADGIVDLSSSMHHRLESLFLDEGFGTLDEDLLDVVASTVEELGASGRMVAVITHINELAERIPTRFELTKSDGGSTVRRVDS